MEILEFIMRLLAWVTVISFLVSGLDDLFFDSNFLVYLFKNRKKPILGIQQLKLVPEQWIAIFVPAWQEGGIVNRMAEYAARIVLYEKYDIFIGVYPNDTQTIECVDRVCAENPRLHKVVVPHPGPTSKADCLNWIYRAMKLNEVPGTRVYKIMAIHDAEDILHPLTLKVYNYFVPATYDMAQLPVFALEHSPWKNWTANTYIDDFSELHTKDLFIRESIGGVVPSAGVGTCFSQRVLDQLAGENRGDPFLLGNLTEDYEIGIRIKRAGFRTGIIHYPVERIVRRRKRDGSLAPPQSVLETVAVREAFPVKFRAAVRQRTRWILGISFQTWEQTGWAGSLPMRYTLLRDRRAPLTHLINMAGYVTLAGVVAQWLFGYTPWSQHIYWRPVFRPDSILWTLVILCTWLLVYRAAQKFISVWHIYNLKQAVFSIPRTVVNNLINFVATVQAVRHFISHKISRREIAWLKTDHVFPGEGELSEYNNSIEDLLVEQGLVTQEQIFQAVKTQGGGSAPECLLRMGLIREEQFTDIWARHSGLKAELMDPARVPLTLLRNYKEEQSLKENALPMEVSGETVRMAYREPPPPEWVQRAGLQLGKHVQPVLALPSAIEFCRHHSYPRLVLAPSPRGDWLKRLRDACGLSDLEFLEVVREHQATLLGCEDILVNRGLMEEVEARKLLADHLRLSPSTIDQPVLDFELFYAAGPAFWWLHRMLPVTDKTILTCVPPHPDLIEWLTPKVGSPPHFGVELPAKLDQIARQLKASYDPEQALLDSLAGKDLLTEKELEGVAAAQKLIDEPLPGWLRLRNMVSEKNLHDTFLEISCLPAAEAQVREEVLRLLPILPPGFAKGHGCYPLRAERNITLGLSELPTDRLLKSIYSRLQDYPLFFKALSLSDAGRLKQLV